MRRVPALLGAIALLFATVGGAAANAPFKETDHIRDAGCSGIATSLGSAEFYISISDVNGTDGYLDVWAGEPYASDLILARDFDRPVSGSIGPGTVSITVPLLPSGEAAIAGTLAPADTISYDEQFRDGNSTFRASGNGTAYALTGTLVLPGALAAPFGPDGCSASDVATSVFLTQPHASVRSFASTSGFCQLTNAAGDSADVFLSVENESMIADVSVTDAGGARIGAFGGTPLDSAGNGVFTLDEYDPDTGNPTGAVATVSISVVDTGETFDYTLRPSNGFQRVNGSLLDVAGALTTSLGSFDLDPCIIAATRTKEIGTPSSGPKPGGKRPANDLPSGAVAVKPGDRGIVATKGAQRPSEADYPCLTFDDPFGDTFSVPVEFTVWYKVTGTGLPMTFDTAGSDYDTVVGVYTGSPGAFTNIACVDDVALQPLGRTLQAAATFGTVAGTTYWIQAGGLNERTAFLPYGTLKVAIR